MVDRITPAATPELLDNVSSMLQVEDKLAIETEPFTQWVIEDKFCGPRPFWEKVGALLVDDVAPYEHMKLRMLNGAHSLIAYLGHVHGCKYVRDAMAHPHIQPLVLNHFNAALRTLAPLPGVDFNEYAKQLAERFENPNIAHETYQIAMDGTQKLPQRIFSPAIDALKLGQVIDSFALATAAWMFYCYVGVNGQSASGLGPYALRDPREAEIKNALESVGPDAVALRNALFGLSDFLPKELAESEAWSDQVTLKLACLLAGELDQLAG